MPGAGGRLLVGTRVCPACGELNPLSRTHCLRCAADLDPPAPPPPPPPPPPPVLLPPPPAPVVEKGIPWWVWVLVAVAFVIVTVLVILMVR